MGPVQPWRRFGICLMLAGVGFVAVLTAAAERLVGSRREDQRAIKHQLDEILRRLAAIRGQPPGEVVFVPAGPFASGCELGSRRLRELWWVPAADAHHVKRKNLYR